MKIYLFYVYLHENLADIPLSQPRIREDSLLDQPPAWTLNKVWEACLIYQLFFSHFWVPKKLMDLIKIEICRFIITESNHQLQS